MTTQYKLYTHALDGENPEPVIAGESGLLPRINAESDAAAIAHARALVVGHPDRQKIGHWELTELDAQDVNIRTVHLENIYHSECGNCHEQDAERPCDGCGFEVCEACWILHNEDLDGQEPQGFVVVNVSGLGLLGQDDDPDGPRVFDNIQDARECVAEARAVDGCTDIYVFRVGPVGDQTAEATG